MIGYSGSGYKGMQLYVYGSYGYESISAPLLTLTRNHKEKTIEGDLFTAFVAAGAISKANADDPKKSSLIRCARTDKGVHAAGNVISLKLIIEEPDIVFKINEKLSPQIRVWGIEQTNGAFSAYQLCDSRIYEYLIPTHCFIPPHPRSFLGKKMAELAEEANDLEGYQERQQDAANFWAETEEKYIKSLMGTEDQYLAEPILTTFYETSQALTEEDPTLVHKLERYAARIILDEKIGVDSTKFLSASDTRHPPSLSEARKIDADPAAPPHEISPLEILTRHLKDQHTTAKKAYRISPARLARVRSTLSRYVGSHRFHNYTIEKTFRDPSATRVIKSFVVGDEPIIINNTEWLSLKVHGQSFMMHQIRKMVSMAALLVRCGCHEGRIQDTYQAERLSIPKAPSLGLLLERPVFDEYNKKLEEFGRARINFTRYEKELEEFKQREIYERIFREEERDNSFQAFFAGLDGTRSAQLLYLSSVGIEAVKKDVGRFVKDGEVGLRGAGEKDEGDVKAEGLNDEVMEDDDLKQESTKKEDIVKIQGVKEELGVKMEDVNDVSSEDEKGGHDEG